jgi:hypothetical protein
MSRSNAPLSIRRCSPLAFLATALLLLPLPVQAQEGLTYTISPSVRWIEWDEDLAFSGSRLLGGVAGIGFGRFVSLQAFHHWKEDLGLFQVTDAPSPARRFDLAQSGLQASLALGSGAIVPVVAGGGSLLRFDSPERDRLTKLSVDFGGGLRAYFGETLQGEVLLESTQFRLDPSLLLEGVAGEDGPGPLRRNTTLRAGLGLQLGGGPPGRDAPFPGQPRDPLAEVAFALEPLAGRLDYDGAIDLKAQDMIGLRAGLDFGPFFGLRGFHWWGTASDFRSTTDMRAWGGEAQFNLGSGPGVNPFLTGGAGQLTWGEAGENEAPRPKDQTALIVGGGLEFNLGPNLRATVAARNFILGGSDLFASPDLQGISDPDELVHNWQFSGGLKLLVGRSGIRSGTRVAEAWEPAPPVAQPPARPAAPPQPPAPVEEAEAPPVPGFTPVAPPPGVQVRVDTLVQGALPGQTMVLPILEQGEIYIRFGEGGSLPLLAAPRYGLEPVDPQAPGGAPEGPTLNDLRRLIREELARQHERSGVDQRSVAAMEARLLRRLDEMEARLQRQLVEITSPGVRPADRPPLAPPRTPGAPPAGATLPEEEEELEQDLPFDPLGRWVDELRPMGGVHLTGDVQILAGIGADIGPIRPESRIKLVPQVLLGLGQGPVSFSVTTDLEYPFPEIRAGRRVVFEPLASVGPGVIKRDRMDLQLGAFLGTGLRLYERDGSRGLHLLVGLRGIDLFQDTRLILGLRSFR